MPLHTDPEDVNAMLTLTNLRKWVESWPNKVIAIRNSPTSCPVAMYLREGEGVLLAEVSTTSLGWCNVDLKRMEEYRKNPMYEYSKAFNRNIMVLPIEISSFIMMVDKVLGTKKIFKTTVLKYIDELQHKYREGPHCDCIDSVCLPSRRGVCREL